MFQRGGSVRPGHQQVEIAHSLAVVDVMEMLAGENPGSRVTTEREIRAKRGREVGRFPRTDERRIPDGELVLASGHVVAVEVDLTPKRSPKMEEIIRRYMDDSYAAVWWFVRPRTVERMTDVVRACGATKLVEIHPWDPRSQRTGVRAQ